MANFALSVPGINGSITLVGYGLTVWMEDFLSDVYIRRDIEGMGLQYSAAGTSARTGPVYIPKQIWDIRVSFRNPGTALDLVAMHSAYKESPQNLVLHDNQWPWIETAPRSRALASGGGELALSGGRIAYPAAFNVEFVGESPQLVDKGHHTEVSFVVQEADIATP